MGPYKKLYKREYATELLSIAKGDLDSATALRNAELGRPENIFYMGQQSIEKSLKAILCARGEEILHTHDIEALLVAIGDDVEIPHREAIVSLTEFAMIRRYQEGVEVYSDATLDAVLSICKTVVASAEVIVSLTLAPTNAP